MYKMAYYDGKKKKMPNHATNIVPCDGLTYIIVLTNYYHST